MEPQQKKMVSQLSKYELGQMIIALRCELYEVRMLGCPAPDQREQD